MFDGSWETPPTGITDYLPASGARMDTQAGRLFLKTIFPENVKYHVIGGAGYENYIESTATNYGPDCGVQDYNMLWRVEVRPADSQAECNFLNFLEITETAADEIADSTATACSSNVHGITITGSAPAYVVLFSTGGNNVESLSYYSPVSAKHLAFNMAEGSYDIYLDNEKLFSEVSASSEGCLAFDAAGTSGYYRILPTQSNSRPPAPPVNLEIR